MIYYNMSIHCDPCNLDFNTNALLKRHYKSKKHYIKANQILVNFCCGVKFSSKSNYLQHLKNMHQIDTTPLVGQNFYLIDLKTDRKTHTLVKNHLINDS